jgi:hypothetical protein
LIEILALLALNVALFRRVSEHQHLGDRALRVDQAGEH